MKKLNIVVVIVSDTRTDDTDKSGKKLKHLIENDGHNVLGSAVPYLAFTLFPYFRPPSIYNNPKIIGALSFFRIEKFSFIMMIFT